MTHQILSGLLYRLLHGLLEVLFPISSANLKSKAKLPPLYYENSSEYKTYQSIQYALTYQNPEIKRLIWKFKYYLHQDALEMCANVLYDQLIADISDTISKIPFQKPYILVHCPSSTYFKGLKKFDHMKELTLRMDALQDSHNPFFTCCIHAIVPNERYAFGLDSQHTGTRAERLAWAKQRFELSESFVQYMRDVVADSKQNTPDLIYCIDDVVTSGASMKAISQMLQEKLNIVRAGTMKSAVHCKIELFCICH